MLFKASSDVASCSILALPARLQSACGRVGKERDCCGFLNFDLREVEQEVRLTITAPEETREAAFLFEQFVGSVEQASSPLPCEKERQSMKKPPVKGKDSLQKKRRVPQP